MSVHVNELHKKVLDEYTLALLSHCYVHLSNLVLQKGFCNNKEWRIFFNFEWPGSICKSSK